MILDEQALFSDKQAVTADAASTNVIKVGGNIAKGTPVEILAQVVEQDFATLTSLEIKVQTATDSAESRSSAPRKSRRKKRRNALRTVWLR